MAIVLTDKLQNGIAGSGLIDAASIDTTNNNKTQQEVNNDLLGRTGADIPINGTDTGISIDQAIESISNALATLKGDTIPLSSDNSKKITTAITELAQAINAISLTTDNVTEGTGESQISQATINEGFRKKTANLDTNGELTANKIKDSNQNNKTQQAINAELYNTIRPSCVELGASEIITSVNCVADTYYNIILPVNTLAINLPALTGEAVVKSVVVRFTVGNTPNITFTTPTGTTYNLINSIRFVPNSTYEISAISNTDSWHIGYIGVDEPLLKTHTYSANMVLTGEVDTYHVINGLVSGLTIHLPVVTTSTRLKSCMVFFKTTNDVNETLSITIDTTDSIPVVLAADIAYHKNDIYEINALYNGNSWVVSVNTYN